MIGPPGFFASFERKDWLTLFASTAALSVSLLTYIQRTRAGQMAMRRQLTELLQKLADLTLQADIYRALEGNPKRDEYPRNYLGLLNEQRRFLVRQAEFVTRRIGNLVSPYESLLIAEAFDTVDDSAQAEKYFVLAVHTARTPVDRGIAGRRLARFLFSHGRRDEARERYAAAVAAFDGDSDDMRLYRAHTHEAWAAMEQEGGHPDEASRQLARAAAECAAISNGRRRHHEEQRLASRRARADS